jgi:hypothetical protein
LEFEMKLLITVTVAGQAPCADAVLARAGAA